MPSIFNDFVDAMVSGQPLDAGLFQELWSALRAVLRSEMRRRGIWQTRPSFLGVVGYSRWSDGGSGQGPLDELTSDCFEYVFVRRLPSLERQARLKDSIDGVVLLAIRHFLLAAQSRHDPLGFRVYEVVSASLRQALEDGRLTCIAGSPKIRNETCLARKVTASVDLARQVDVEPLVDLWAGRRLESLVTASHQRLKDLKLELIVDVEDFLEDDRPGFRFGNLMGPLKERVRRTWAARFLSLPGFLNVGSEDEIDHSLDMEDLLALRDHVAAVVRCVDEAGSPARKAKARRYFALLWGYLKGYAFEDLRRWVRDGANRVRSAEDEGPDGLPSARQLAEALGIPRARLPQLFEHLQARWRDCEDWASTAGKEQPMSRDGSGGPTQESAQGRAWASWQTAVERRHSDRETHSTDGSWLRSGDLFEVPGTQVRGDQARDVLWCAVSQGPGDDTLTCCPVDTFPLVDDHDVDLSWTDTEGEPYVVRLGLSMEIAVAALGSVLRVGRLSPEGLEAVLEEEIPEPSLETRRQGWMPSYRAWMEQGPLVAQAALRAHLEKASSKSTAPRDEDGSRPLNSKKLSRSFWAAAAGLLLMVSGAAWHFRGQAVDLRAQVEDLGGRVEELGGEVARWKAPAFGVQDAEVKLNQTLRGEVILDVAEDDRFYWVTLVPDQVHDYPSFRIEGLNDGGNVLFSSRPLPFELDYRILLPVDLLKDGPVELRLIGLRGDDETILEFGAIRPVRGTD